MINYPDLTIHLGFGEGVPGFKETKKQQHISRIRMKQWLAQILMVYLWVSNICIRLIESISSGKLKKTLRPYSYLLRHL